MAHTCTEDTTLYLSRAPWSGSTATGTQPAYRRSDSSLSRISTTCRNHPRGRHNTRKQEKPVHPDAAQFPPDSAKTPLGSSCLRGSNLKLPADSTHHHRLYYDHGP